MLNTLTAGSVTFYLNMIFLERHNDRKFEIRDVLICEVRNILNKRTSVNLMISNAKLSRQSGRYQGNRNTRRILRIYEIKKKISSRRDD